MVEAVILGGNHEAKIKAAEKLFSHLPPTNDRGNVEAIRAMVPGFPISLRALPSRVLSVAEAAAGREFLTCEQAQRKVGERIYYKCPWNGKFYTVEGEALLDDAVQPPTDFENALNEAVSTYCTFYFGNEGALSSAFADAENGLLRVIIQIKKSVANITEGNEDAESDAFAPCHATWDSMHVFEVSATDEADTCQYKHTASLTLSFSSAEDEGNSGKLQCLLAGSIARSSEQVVRVANEPEHVPNIGRQVEETESRLRNEVQTIYFGRPHDAINELRRAVPDGFLRNQNDLRAEMMAKLAQRQ